MRILGIDPGTVGGAAIYVTDGAARAWGMIDIPIAGEGAKLRVNAMELRDWIISGNPDHCFIERAQAMPEQGASSGFKYGRAVGALEAIVACCNVPMTIIEPRAWKKFHGLSGLGRTLMTLAEVKECSRQRALQLMPSAHKLLARKMDHGRAEALLIAMYGSRVLLDGNAIRSSAPALLPLHPR